MSVTGVQVYAYEDVALVVLVWGLPIACPVHHGLCGELDTSNIGADAFDHAFDHAIVHYDCGCTLRSWQVGGPEVAL